MGYTAAGRKTASSCGSFLFGKDREKQKKRTPILDLPYPASRHSCNDICSKI